MRIGIEAQRIFRAKKHGMDLVALEVIKQLQELNTDDEYFVFVASGPDVCLGDTRNVHIILLHCPFYPLWEQIALPLAVKQYKIDLLHCTSNTAPLYCKVPLVLTLHDIIFLEPQKKMNKSIYQNLGRIYRRFVVPKIVRKCSSIITVSESEKERIEQLLDVPPDRLTVVYNGYSKYFHKIQNSQAVSRKYIDTDEYIFFLGNTDPKKNVPGTLNAYRLYLEKSDKQIPLLIADISANMLDSILKEIGCSYIRQYIVCSGYIPNRELPYIYNSAKIFLYTSYRESFGIPMLESMACGTPVIVGNKSAMPEIAGAGVDMVDVSDPECIADAIIRLETDEDYYKQQIDYGLERVNAFSWKCAAERLQQLYGYVLSKRKK